MITRILTDEVPAEPNLPDCSLAEAFLHGMQPEPAQAEAGRLREALAAITDHFARVMGGPMIAGRGVKFANGVEGIPTIARARSILAESVLAGTGHRGGRMTEAEQLRALTTAQRRYLSHRFCRLCEQPLHRQGCGAIYEPCTEETRCTRRADCLASRKQEEPPCA